jgi:aryl-alcohol dehydrogenase-like predicted oxidoreductase
MMGECSKETAFEILDTYYDLGGNFIDTANAYHGGQSEQWIGEWLQKTGRRSEIVLATKYTMSPMTGRGVQESNYGGTGTKSMHVSINDSLKRLQTDYIDLVGDISTVIDLSTPCPLLINFSTLSMPGTMPPASPS